MRFYTALLLIFLCRYFLFSQVVINEILYNPGGSDSGYEWIELYNPTDENINLKSWQIQKAGSQFETCFTFDNNILIHSHSFLLVGEEFVTSADIIATLSFQNGGSATDGVRIISPNSDYTDTILYDEPNSNNLPDDNGSIGTELFANVSQGHTIARIYDGIDTNTVADWFDCSNPTPKSSNIVPIDLAISNFHYEKQEDNYYLFATVKNLSTISVDNFDAMLYFSMDKKVIQQNVIPYINIGDSTYLYCQTPDLPAGYHTFKAEINCLNDNNLENNLSNTSILIGISPIILNELMIKPENEDNEWVEIFNRGNVDNSVDNLFIYDRTDRKITLYGKIKDYLVICKNKELFNKRFPEADTSKVIQSESWTSLNNTTENLYLKDAYGTVFDTLYYNAYHLPENISYERVNPYSDNNIKWKSCKNDNGGTPTFANSNLPLDTNLVIKFIKIEKNGSILSHHIKIFNNGLNPIGETELNCFQKKNDDDFTLIYSQEVSLSDTAYIDFESSINSNGYYTFKYSIGSDEDETDNTDYGFFNQNELPFVINEIMYNPNVDEPEWLEIEKNYQTAELDSFYLMVGDDYYYLPMSGLQYFLITSDNDASIFLQDKYNLSTPPLIGLSALSNTGKELALYDKNSNLIEDFFYEPDWNNKQKGVSIERINPTVAAKSSNFGPSIETCTPQRQNSLFVQILPPTATLSITPNPFSPYNSEHTVIQYKLPSPINKITVKIFDLKGREVNKIVENTLGASKGDIIWDGKDKNNKNLPIGIYIVNFSGIGTLNDKIFKKLKTIVIKK